MAFYQLFHLILHEIDRFGCFMLKSGFFSKSLVLCLRNSKNCVQPLRLYWRDFKIIFHTLLTFYFKQWDRLGGMALLRLTDCMLSLEILSF